MLEDVEDHEFAQHIENKSEMLILDINVLSERMFDILIKYKM